MSKSDKLILKIQKKPTPADFKWEELKKLLAQFGFSLVSSGKTGGSRRKFINDAGILISLHEPHPSKVLKKYQVEQVIDILKQEGFL